MRVSGLTNAGDWQFGHGRAPYLQRSAAIRQNVVTRLRSFSDDWFLDIEEGIDWVGLLSRKGTETQILRAIERSVLQTEGVRTINRLRIAGIDSRSANIEISITDIFDVQSDNYLVVP